MAQAIRNAIRANRFARFICNFQIPIFKARQADSRESLEFPIRIRANRANRFARVTPLRRRRADRKAKLKSAQNFSRLISRHFSPDALWKGAEGSQRERGTVLRTSQHFSALP